MQTLTTFSGVRLLGALRSAAHELRTERHMKTARNDRDRSLVVSVLLWAGFGLSCADDSKPRPASPFQLKSSQREDQTELSSHNPCYCFPKGPICTYGLDVSGPEQAPDDVPACPIGEVCDSDSSRYSDGFSGGPQGKCLRLCFYFGARVPDANNPEIQKYSQMDCAAGEECFVQPVDRGIEDWVRGWVGMCLPAPRNPSMPQEPYTPFP